MEGAASITAKDRKEMTAEELHPDDIHACHNKGSGGPHPSFLVPKGRLQTMEFPLHKGRITGNKNKFYHEKFHLDIRNTFFFFFTVRTSDHWNNLPRDVMESPSLEVFQKKRDRVSDHLIYIFFSTKGHTRWFYQVPSNLDCSMITKSCCP